MNCERNSTCEELFKNERRYGPDVGEWDQKRRKLLGSLTLSDLVWVDWPLRDDPAQSMKDAPYRIDVCAAVKKSGLFIPVTADETFCLASRWGLFPLTSAVMDQTAFTSNYVPRKVVSNTVPEIYDFKNYSKYLNGTAYARTVCVGAHKVWIISARGRRINYGFHFRDARQNRTDRYFGKGWRALQWERGGHENDPCHWDYSQLLQFMRNLTTKSGEPLSIADEIKRGNPALLYQPSGTPKRMP